MSIDDAYNLDLFFNTGTLGTRLNTDNVEVRLSEEQLEAIKPHDSVNHPKHYTSHPSKVECIEITEHYNFCIGNAIKYLWRCGLKDEALTDPKLKQIEDLKKAIWYINREISNLENNKYERN